MTGVCDWCVSTDDKHTEEALKCMSPQETLAMRVPPGIIINQGSCTPEYLVIEFWRGTICLGDCQLPIAKIKEAAAFEVRPLMHSCGDELSAVSAALSRFTQRAGITRDADNHLTPRFAAPPTLRCVQISQACHFAIMHGLLYENVTQECKQQHRFLSAEATPAAAPSAGLCDPNRPSRTFQMKRWLWEAFICHAGEDKAFARLLREHMLPHSLRCFVDEDSLRIGQHAPQAMEAAVRSTQIAVVLLCEEFFQREAPLQELRWFLEGSRQRRNALVPVFLGITVEKCQELARPVGLEAVCEYSGVRHACEHQRFTGVPVHEEYTMHRIIQTVREMTGV